jgi:hypothetical protein
MSSSAAVITFFYGCYKLCTWLLHAASCLCPCHAPPGSQQAASSTRLPLSTVPQQLTEACQQHTFTQQSFR